MVDTILTKEKIEIGRTLIVRLDGSTVQPDAAFWFFSPDTQEWKLVLVEKKLNKLGPKHIYKEVQNIIINNKEELGDMSLDDITLIKPDSPLVKLLRMAVRTGPDITGIRIKNNVINGTVIEDAYIYRLL